MIKSATQSDSSELLFENQMKRLWNIHQVADYLGVKPRTIRGWIFSDKIPYHKIGKFVRFNPCEVKKWALQ